MADTRIEAVTEIGTFGSLNISDPTTINVDPTKNNGLVDAEAVEEDLDMDELAKRIMKS